MKRILLILSLLLGTLSVNAQELSCIIEIEPDPSMQLTATDKQIFEELKEAMFNFVNNTQWTSDKFSFEERIECSMLLSITDIGGGGTRFKGKLQVRSTRPVYKTGYRTPTFSFMDEDIVFNFQRNTILQFSPQQHLHNLTSILAFYSYMILGFDYDSFSLEGGTPYFNKAQTVVNNAQNAPEPGWQAFGSGNKNRYLLIDNILHQAFKPLRKCNYDYHRLGFDMMHKNLEEGRAEVAKSLQQLVKVYNNRPGSFIMQDFCTMKRTEIINLFGESFPKEKGQVINVMKKIDPSNSDKYQDIMKRN